MIASLDASQLSTSACPRWGQGCHRPRQSSSECTTRPRRDTGTTRRCRGSSPWRCCGGSSAPSSVRICQPWGFFPARSLCITHSHARRVADGKEVAVAVADVALAGRHGQPGVAKDAVEAGVDVAQGLVAAAAAGATARPLVKGRQLALDKADAGLAGTAVALDEAGDVCGRDAADGGGVDACDGGEDGEKRSEALIVSGENALGVNFQ